MGQTFVHCSRGWQQEGALPRVQRNRIALCAYQHIIYIFLWLTYFPQGCNFIKMQMSLIFCLDLCCIAPKFTIGGPRGLS